MAKKKVVEKAEKVMWYRGEPCMSCGNPATVTNQNSICKKCIKKYFDGDELAEPR